MLIVIEYYLNKVADWFIYESLSKSVRVCVCVWFAEPVSTQHDSAFDLADTAKGFPFSGHMAGHWHRAGRNMYCGEVYIFVADMAFQELTAVSCSVTCILFSIFTFLYNY